MQGIIINFNEQKAYGFIKTDAYEENVFVHITQVKNADDLTLGQEVEFEIEKTQKGLAAINVMAGKKHRSPYLIFGFISFGLILAIFIYATQYLPTLISYLIAINVVTFLMYGYDKYISSGEQLRIPEINLQALALLGGSPSALVAQKFFRHKTIKTSFQITYWVIILLQVGLLSYL